MSETQNEYETDAKFNEDESWEVAKIPGIVVRVDERDQVASVRGRSEKEMIARARLIAAAGTAAQEARKMGYDPQKAVEALPELLHVVESFRDSLKALDRNFRGTFEGEKEAVENFLDALASAEGSDHE